MMIFRMEIIGQSDALDIMKTKKRKKKDSFQGCGLGGVSGT